MKNLQLGGKPGEDCLVAEIGVREPGDILIEILEHHDEDNVATIFLGTKEQRRLEKWLRKARKARE